MIGALVGGVVVACSAIHIPLFLKLRQSLRAKEAEKETLAAERKQFFESIQAAAAAHAPTGCRLCSVCKRVVYRFVVEKEAIVCFECRLK